jgi:hypothetical protein
VRRAYERVLDPTRNSISVLEIVRIVFLELFLWIGVVNENRPPQHRRV